MVQLICSMADGMKGAGLADGVGGWVVVWLAYTVFGCLILTTTSIAVFIWLYCNPTYEKWIWKSNPKYPTTVYVLGEMFLGGPLGVLMTTLAPSIHLFLIANGTLRHHCDTPLTWQHRLFSVAVGFIITDFYEWGWHFLGHYVSSLWTVHKHHHKYYNPTPFGTIADYPTDNIIRSLYFFVDNLVSCAIFGCMLDIDMVYLVTAMPTILWGMYLHCGHEIPWLPYDHPVLNTSFQHYVHHAASVKNKPYHTGFFIKLWDQMAGSVYKGEILSAVEDQKLGNRSRERWEKEVLPTLPDYSVLLSPSFWLKNWRMAPGLAFWGGH